MSKQLNLARVDSKKALRDLQRTFAKIIRRPLAAHSKMRKDRRTSTFIAGNNNSTPHQRLEFYAQQYWWRLIDSLDEDFPTVQKLMPKANYERLRNAYLSKCPSVSFTIRNLGARFPAFIKRNPRLIGRNPELIRQAALFDWAIIEAFTASETEPLTPKLFIEKTFLNKKLFLQPHVQILDLSYPIDLLFKKKGILLLEGASNIRLPADSRTRRSRKPALSKAKTYLAIHRFQGYSHIKRITRVQMQILNAFKQGASLATLAKQSARMQGFSDQECSQFFSELMALGWLSLAKK